MFAVFLMKKTRRRTCLHAYGENNLTGTSVTYIHFDRTNCQCATVFVTLMLWIRSIPTDSYIRSKFTCKLTPVRTALIFKLNMFIEIAKLKILSFLIDESYQVNDLPYILLNEMFGYIFFQHLKR